LSLRREISPIKGIVFCLDILELFKSYFDKTLNLTFSGTFILEKIYIRLNGFVKCKGGDLDGDGVGRDEITKDYLLNKAIYIFC